MDRIVMLICKFGDQIYPVRLSVGVQFTEVMNSLHNRWKSLTVGKFSLSYELDGCLCLLENDDDLQKMLFLFGNADRINARVELNEVDIHSDLMLCGPSNEVLSSAFEVTDGEEDRFDKFCRHAEVSYLTEHWAHLIENVGQVFTGGVNEFRSALQKYSIENGFMYKFKKNDKLRVTAYCVVDGCKWYVHAILDRCTRAFVIKELHNEHNCGSTYRTNKHKRLTSGLVAEEIVGMVEKRPKSTPIDYLDWWTEKYGIDLPYHTTWLGVEKARAQLFGDYTESFDKLRWYVEAAKVLNPGSLLALDYDPVTKEFSRIFVAFSACIRGFSHCRPVICVDAAHLKGRFKGNLMAATGKDADQGLFPVAYAIVGAENEDNWLWFLEHLRRVLSSRVLTFISDRHPSLVKNVPLVFPECDHAYCIFHLMFNLKDHFPGRHPKGFRKRLVELFKDCAHAPTVSRFMECEAEFYKYGGEKAKSFMASVDRSHWCNAFFKGQRYGEMTSSAIESFNNWVIDERHMPVLHLVDALRSKIMTQMAERREAAMEWNSVLCPSMDKILVSNINKGRSWKVRMSRAGLYEVNSVPPVTVSLDDMTCSCGSWQFRGFLCKHAATVIIKARGGEGSLAEYIDPFYKVEAYLRTYQDNIVPIVEMDVPDFTKGSELVVKPPRNRRPAGRPRLKRIPSRGEASKKTRSVRCSRCDKVGSHNRRTCTEPTD